MQVEKGEGDTSMRRGDQDLKAREQFCVASKLQCNYRDFHLHRLDRDGSAGALGTLMAILDPP